MAKNKIKPTSVRISESLLSKIDSLCNDVNCSRNEYITSVLDEAVHNEIKENEDQTTKQDEEEPKPKEPKPSLEEIPELKNPKIVVTDFNPDNYEIKSEPKPIIKEIPQDNSNKPPIEMVLFNGKYIQKAEVYEI